MDRVSICRIKNNIIVNSDYLSVNGEYVSRKIREFINDAVKEGFHRINLIIVNTLGLSFGEIIKVIGMTIKNTVFPSLSLWVVSNFKEVDEIIELDLGDVYGKGL